LAATKMCQFSVAKGSISYWNFDFSRLHYLCC